MTSRGGVWPLSSAGGLQSQTSNSQYGQWFDPARRPTTSISVARPPNAAASRQHDPQTSSSAVPPSDAPDRSHPSRDQLGTSRDYLVTSSSSSSCDDPSSRLSVQSSPRAADSRGDASSWRLVTLPPSIQRSATALGSVAAGQINSHAAASGASDGPLGQSHADLIREYRRYRQLQAGIAGDQTAWRDANRLLTRQPAAGVGCPASGSAVNTQPAPTTSYLQSSTTGGAVTPQQQQQQRGRTEAESTTVVPLLLGGPLPVQCSVGSVISARRGAPPDYSSMRRAQTGYAPGRPLLSSFVNVDNALPPSDTVTDLSRQLNSPAQPQVPV